MEEGARREKGEDKKSKGMWMSHDARAKASSLMRER